MPDPMLSPIVLVTHTVGSAHCVYEHHFNQFRLSRSAHDMIASGIWQAQASDDHSANMNSIPKSEAQTPTQWCESLHFVYLALLAVIGTELGIQQNANVCIVLTTLHPH
jgi:hypothetical protein